MLKLAKRGLQQPGFTIVELLVVIVVIGILAAVITISYTGLSNRASVAGLQVDLESISKQLKLFNVEKGYYPTTISTNCTTNPDSSTNKCVKPSANNTISLCNYSNNTQTFTLIGVNGSNVYKITESSGMVSASASSAIFSSGVSDGCYKVITYNGTASGTLNAIGSGNLDVTVIGGGGGGSGDDYDDCGAAPSTAGGTGGQSKISIGSNNYIANGGTGGFCGNSGTNGTVSFPAGFTNTTSSGLAGNFGTGAPWDGDQFSNSGVNGSSGGKITGTISIVSGQTLTVNAGAAGAGGTGHATYNGGAGGAGQVVIKYPIYQ
jgi:prepilin-type N-terminal cleavage/methylation domain-containing protein